MGVLLGHEDRVENMEEMGASTDRGVCWAGGFVWRQRATWGYMGGAHRNVSSLGK